MASPERIRVAAVAGILAQVPGMACVHGGQAEYLGRRTCHKGVAANAFVRKQDGVKCLRDLEASHPPDATHNSEFTREAHSDLYPAIRRLLLEGSVAAVDDATAKWAGVKFSASATITNSEEV